MSTPDPDDAMPPGAIPAGAVEYWAAVGNYDQTLKRIRDGNDVNERGDGGYTALHAAAENRHIDIIKLLLDHGADRAAALTSGETPADLAALAGHDDVIQLLSQ